MWVNNTLIVFGVANTVQNRAKGDGARLGGGRGTVFGCILGVMFVAVTQNGLNLLGVSPFAFQMIIGAVILVAISTSNISLSSEGLRRFLGSTSRTRGLNQ